MDIDSAFKRMITIFESRSSKHLKEIQFRMQEQEAFFENIASGLVYNITEKMRKYPVVGSQQPVNPNNFDTAIDEAIEYHKNHPEKRTLICCELCYTVREVPEKEV